MLCPWIPRPARQRSRHKIITVAQEYAARLFCHHTMSHQRQQQTASTAGTAKPFVIDESGEWRIRCTISASRIVRQSHLMKLTAPGIDAQQFPLQRLAETENQLQHLQRLQLA